MITILLKELSSFFNSLIAYIVIGVFLLFTGLLFWLYPDTNILDYGYAEMGSFFEIMPYLFLFFIPAITMRMFSDEIKSGTLEVLLTKPVSVGKIVSGKFLACLIIIMLAMLPTLLYYYAVYRLGNPVGNIDSAAVAGSYIGLIFLASVYSAIGVFMSSITRNQVIAFLLAALTSYMFLVGFDQIAGLFRGKTQYALSSLGFNFHYNSLSKGVLDSRSLIYFLTVSVLFLTLTMISLGRLRK